MKAHRDYYLKRIPTARNWQSQAMNSSMWL